MTGVTSRTPLWRRGHVNPEYDDGAYAPLYLTSSLGNVSFDMEELESLALSRLRLLKAADLVRQSSSTGYGSATTSNVNMAEEVKMKIRQAEREHGLSVPIKYGPEREEAVLKDEASHFLVRLALCKNGEQRAWLLGREWDLFMTRLEGSGVEFALGIIEKAKGPQIVKIGVQEMDGIRKELEAVARGVRGGRGSDDKKYYKVAFEEVPGLVRGRRVVVKGGWAYVPVRNILDVVGAHFRTRLNMSLAVAAKGVGYAEADQRMRPVLESIRAHYAASAGGGKRGFDTTGATGPESINLSGLIDSIPAMPLCMRNMMEKLRQDHHLKYSGRLILGAFLKGCGLTMEESLRFWQTEFAKGHIDAEKFKKEYAYNIRHQYGKEGKRQSLTPYSCMRVINDRPGPGEHHGCPYREFSENRLKASLRRMGADPDAVDVIAAKAGDGHFQIACGMCFRATQPMASQRSEATQDFIPNHPNEYFIEARRQQLKVFNGGPIHSQEEQAQVEIDKGENNGMGVQRSTSATEELARESGRGSSEPMDVDFAQLRDLSLSLENEKKNDVWPPRKNEVGRNKQQTENDESDDEIRPAKN